MFKKMQKNLEFFRPPPFLFFSAVCVCMCISVTVISQWLSEAFLWQEMAVSMHCSNGYVWLS